MTNARIQLRVNTQLKRDSERAALDMGFNSLQDAIQIFLINLKNRNVNVVLMPNLDTSLTKQQREKVLKQYSRVQKEVDAGKFKEFDNSEDMIKYLAS